tara:strand:+ start:252 stop:737 length:486 start_codon:yes stop_codon:yes gene_type:complete
MLPATGPASKMSTYDLFLALIVLTCLILVLILVYFLHYCIKRDQERQNLPQHPPDDDEAALPIPLYAQKVQTSRPDIEHPYNDEQQRLSRLTTVAPSIELLPEIRTSGSSERAEDWLERRSSRLVDGDLEMKREKMDKVLGVTSEPDGAKIRDEGRREVEQ